MPPPSARWNKHGQKQSTTTNTQRGRASPVKPFENIYPHRKQPLRDISTNIERTDNPPGKHQRHNNRQAHQRMTTTTQNNIRNALIRVRQQGRTIGNSAH